jgi:hypothetical protein
LPPTGELDQIEEKNNLLALNKLVLENKLDKEFKIMLSFYYSIANWYFESFKNIEQLLDFKKKEKAVDIREISFTSNRGQMGAYWNSLTRV